MKSNMQGMDTEAARGHAQQMDSHASAVNEMVATITKMLGSVEWTGDDAKTFQEDWHGSFAPQAQGATDAIQQNANVLRKHADRQDAISR